MGNSMANKKINNKTNKKKTKRYRDPHETLTLKYWLIGALVVALIVGGTVLATSLFAKAVPIEFVNENGVYNGVIDGSLIQFMKANESFEVPRYVTFDKEGTPYAVCGELKLYRVGYHNKYGRVEWLSVDKYLTDGTYLYFSNYVPVPSLSNFKADTVYVGELTEDDNGRMYSDIFKGDEAKTFLDEYNQKNYHDKTKSAGIKTYGIELHSADYRDALGDPIVVYRLYAVECEDGSWYIYTKTDPTPISMSAHWFGSLKQKTEDTTAPSGSSETPSES